ncbi:hypothetical protein TRVL_07825 [Trypanosoma vivax]|nr:hypothetical protein TRVL_07825 [Trypanosoma vivax]
MDLCVCGLTLVCLPYELRLRAVELSSPHRVCGVLACSSGQHHYWVFSKTLNSLYRITGCALVAFVYLWALQLIKVTMAACACSSNNVFSLIYFLFLSVAVPFRKQTCNTVSFSCFVHACEATIVVSYTRFRRNGCLATWCFILDDGSCSPSAPNARRVFGVTLSPSSFEPHATFSCHLEHYGSISWASFA